MAATIQLKVKGLHPRGKQWLEGLAEEYRISIDAVIRVLVKNELNAGISSEVPRTHFYRGKEGVEVRHRVFVDMEDIVGGREELRTLIRYIVGRESGTLILDGAEATPTNSQPQLELALA